MAYQKGNKNLIEKVHGQNSNLKRTFITYVSTWGRVLAVNVTNDNRHCSFTVQCTLHTAQDTPLTSQSTPLTPVKY